MLNLKKYRVLIWALVFLGVVAVSAATTVALSYSGWLQKKETAATVKVIPVLQKELNLTPEQSVKVEDINSRYREESDAIVTRIREKKTELLDELSRENTDTAELDRITEALSLEQKSLQQSNVKQFLELKKVCTLEQTKKLSQIYSELYGCKGYGKGQGQGQGMGHRHRYGRQGGQGKQGN